MNNRIMLRAKSKDDTKRWLFCFQKCVALVLSHLIDNANAQYSNVRQQTGQGGVLSRIPSMSTSVFSGAAETASTSSGDMASSMEREVRGIVSGIGMTQDYSSYLGNKSSATDGAGGAFLTRMESKNHPMGANSSTSGGLRTQSSDGSSASFLEGLGLEEGSSANIMPYTRVGGSTKVSQRKSLPTEFSTGQPLHTSQDAGPPPLAVPATGSGSMDGPSYISSEGTKYFVPLSGSLRPGESSNNLLIAGRGREVAHSAGSGNGDGKQHQSPHLAASPAIPISFGLSSNSRQISSDSTAGPPAELLKVAGSYEDDAGKTSVLAKAVDLLDEDDDSEANDELGEISDDEYDNEQDEGDNQGDLMFGMDESGESPQTTGGAGTGLDFGAGSRAIAPSPGRKSSSPNHKTSPGKMGAARKSRSGAASPAAGSSVGSRGRSRTNSSELPIKSPKMSPASLLSSMAKANLGDGPTKPGLHWAAGASSRLGPRNTNEDRYVAVNSMGKAHNYSSANSSPSAGVGYGPNNTGSTVHSTGSPDDYGFFAVYDGHCGNQAAQFLQDHLHQRTYKHSCYPHDMETALGQTCVAMDKEFLELCDERRWYAGTTALGVVLMDNRLVMFNIGDCVAVLASSGASAKVLNTPHKPGQPDEEKRIRRANGWITEERELYMGRLHRMDLSDPVVRDKAQQVTWVTIHRVCGELAVSRSIGDPDYKRFVPHEKVDALFNWPEGHNQSFAADLVIPDPEVVTHELTKGDEFFVIASDGLWDVVGPEDAVDKIRSAFKAGKSPIDAAEDLCDLALKLGSSDNVTIVIVRLFASAAATPAS